MKKTLALIFVFMFILTFAVACGDISVEVGIDEYPDSLKPSGDLWGDVSLDIDTKPTSSDSTSGGSSSTGSTAGDSQPSSSSSSTGSKKEQVFEDWVPIILFN